MNDLITNINQVASDFENIKQAIINKGVEVPRGTPTSRYGELISNISGGNGNLNIRLNGLVEHITGVSGWRIGSNGCAIHETTSEHNITYYSVVENLPIYIKADDDSNECKFIWSTVKDVSSSYPNKYLIDTPVTDVVDGIVVVPKEAKYICFSQKIDDVKTGVYKIELA